MSNTYINPKLKEIIEEHKKEIYSFRLFVSGDTILSRRAIINLNLFLNKHLENRYNIDIIDILQYPEFTVSEDIITLPLLIKDKPLPEARVIGDMSNSETLIKEFWCAWQFLVELEPFWEQPFYHLLTYQVQRYLSLRFFFS